MLLLMLMLLFERGKILKKNKHYCSGPLASKRQGCRVGKSVQTKIIASLSTCKRSAKFPNSFLGYFQLSLPHTTKDHGNKFVSAYKKKFIPSIYF